MIRVCHIITKLELGGAQQNTLYTVAHLDRRRFEPSLVTGAEGLLVGEARGLDARVHFVDALVREPSPGRDAAALARLIALLRRERPDIVHTHSSKAGILGRWAATIAGVPHIVHSIHGYGFHDGQPWLARHLYQSVERVTGRFTTSAFVAVSRANMETGLELDLFLPEKVTLIRSGVRLSRFTPRETRPDDGAPAPVVVGMVGCLKPQKAPLDFVDAAARVLEQPGMKDRARFLLVEDGVMRAVVEERIAAGRLSGRVELAGWRRDIPELLRGMDVLLHTSRWEGLPRVFPEAMATGLPIVATRVDGAPEAIEDGVTGFLLPPGDVEGLARRTSQLVADPELRRRMGAAARGRVGPWDIDDMVRRQERLYEHLMAGETERAVELSTQLGSG